MHITFKCIFFLLNKKEREQINKLIDTYFYNNEVADYLRKISKKEAFDHTGLIYGMGHAVYTISDPREVLLKAKARELA